MNTCNTCVYLQNGDECHRFPPQITIIPMPQKHHLTGQVTMNPMPVGAFPNVTPDSWCGEYKQAPSQLLTQ